MSKDVRFYETNPFYNKSHETTSQGECILDLFPLPRIELSTHDVSTNRSPNHVNNDAPLTESDNEGTHPDGIMHDDGDNQDNLQSVAQELNECETTLAAPQRNPMCRQPPTRF